MRKKLPNKRIEKKLLDNLERISHTQKMQDTRLNEVTAVLADVSGGDMAIMEQLAVSLVDNVRDTRSKIRATEGHLLEVREEMRQSPLVYHLREIATIVLAEEEYFRNDPKAQAAAADVAEPDTLEKAFAGLIKDGEAETVVKVVCAGLKVADDETISQIIAVVDPGEIVKKVDSAKRMI